MIYLILAFCSSALISIIMRLGEGRIRNNISLLSVNYLVCILLSLVYSAGSGSLLVPPDAGSVAIVLGIISGIFYFGSFLLYQINIHRNGVVMSSAFMKLGVLVPTMIAIAVFGERPAPGQIAGICLAIAAILMINLSQDGEDENRTVTSPRALILLLLAGGLGDAMSKFYEELGRPEYSSQYLLYTFIVAFVFCTAVALIRGQKFTAPDILYGCLVGIPNYYSARFLLLSLSSVPAVIAYPVFSVGTIIITSIAGVIFFREKMNAKQWAALGIVVLAMILLNTAD